MGPRPHANCYWVPPHRLLAGEYPGDEDEAVARMKLRRHLESGIRLFVDLTEAGELVPYDRLLAEEAAARCVCVEHRRHPIRDVGVPALRSQMVGILDAIDRGIRDSPIVYLHCRGGIGRTGTVVGCFLVRHGRTGPEALAEVARLWTTVAKSASYPDSPETRPQREFVRAWREAPDTTGAESRTGRRP